MLLTRKNKIIIKYFNQTYYLEKKIKFKKN